MGCGVGGPPPREHLTSIPLHVLDVELLQFKKVILMQTLGNIDTAR